MTAGTSTTLIERLLRVLAADERIAYALLFGSEARQTAHAHSDVDVAIGLVDRQQFGARALGELIATLEPAAGRPVHVVLLDEAPPGLAYRVFRDGRPIVVRDQQAFSRRLARAILEYLDFRPVEEIFAKGVLRTDGR